MRINDIRPKDTESYEGRTFQKQSLAGTAALQLAKHDFAVWNSKLVLLKFNQATLFEVALRCSHSHPASGGALSKF